MKTKEPQRLSWHYVAALIAVSACARFLPHMPANFSPVGSMGIYAGAVLPLPWALVVSLSGLFLSDLVLGLYHPVTMLFVYLGLASNVIVGRFLLSDYLKPERIFYGAILGSILFFILSNFGVWLSAGLYAQNIHGLIECYVAAIPFFGNTLSSQLLFCALIFGTHYLMSVYSLKSQRTP